MKRIDKEKEIVALMINLYCNKKHKNINLCVDCQELLEYAHKRLASCNYKNEKISCRKCPTHCYNMKMKESIKRVMRFSGPKILFYKPYEYIRHIIK